MSVVLDSSAMLAVLNNEPGRRFVQDNMQDASISSVNLTEVISKLLDRGASDSELDLVLRATGTRVVGFDEAQARHAAALRLPTRHRGLSLGDRACLALASTLRLPVLTAERAWVGLDAGVEVRVIR